MPAQTRWTDRTGFERERDDVLRAAVALGILVFRVCGPVGVSVSVSSGTSGPQVHVAHSCSAVPPHQHMRQAVDVETTTRDVQQQTHSTYRVHGHDQTTTTWSFSSACVSPEGGRTRSAMRPTRRPRESLWRNKFVPPGVQCRSSCTARRDEDDSCKVPDARAQRVETKVDWGEFGSSQPAKTGRQTQKWRGGFPCVVC
ncbi:hypothetical protein EDB80DRAFT_342544 [Ilyonectria destructans]|nr:hypothetical protein EDB80DRAFT_342544 [Ilyonectria destructans]